MTQFDARMGFAPALLCIEEEPLKKTATVTALKPHPKQKEFDAFAKGNHIAGMIAGASVGVDLASLVSCTTSCLITEYMTRYDAGHRADDDDELTFYTNGQQRSIFRGMHDEPEKKSATEIMMKTREQETRMMREMLDRMSISRPMPAPSGLSMLMEEQRRQEKQLRHAAAFGFGSKDAIIKLTKEKCDVAAARLDAAINGKPIEDYDFWANFDKASHLGGSPFVRFKNDPVAEVKLQTPANPGLADVNAKLQELSGETLKSKRPELDTDWPRWVNGR